MAWLEVLTNGRVWDQQRDTPRIRKAFISLASDRRQWPLPRDFLDALPPSEKLKALPAKASDPERALREIAELTRELQRGVL